MARLLVKYSGYRRAAIFAAENALLDGKVRLLYLEEDCIGYYEGEDEYPAAFEGLT